MLCQPIAAAVRLINGSTTFLILNVKSQSCLRAPGKWLQIKAECNVILGVASLYLGLHQTLSSTAGRPRAAAAMPPFSTRMCLKLGKFVHSIMFSFIWILSCFIVPHRRTRRAVPLSPWRCPLSQNLTKRFWGMSWTSRPQWKRRGQASYIMSVINIFRFYKENK